MSFTTLLINDSTGTIVATLSTNAVSLVKDASRLKYNVAPPGLPPDFEVVDRIVSAASRAEAATATLSISIANGASWDIDGARCSVVSSSTGGGISWSPTAATASLELIARYPDEPDAADINDSPGIYWVVEDSDAPAVKLKVQVKRLTT